MCHPEVPAGTASPQVRTEEVAIPLQATERMPALLTLPERLPASAVLVVNDVFGRSAFYENLTRRLAQAGFIALDPEYFFRDGSVPSGDREAAQARSAKLDQSRTLEDLKSAAEWLRRRPDGRGRIGSIGFCMGGTLVLDLAAWGKLDAIVSYYGFPARRSTSPNAPPVPLEIAEKLKGPILGFWGDQDTGVGVENVEALRGKLAKTKIEHEFHIYPGLGHGFLKAFLEDESSPGYQRACESWTRTLEFLQEKL